VLHTRISDELSEDIRRFAEDLRVPASNLVRNVLEEVFSVVETVSDNVGDMFDDLLEEAEEARERMHHRREGYEKRHSRRDRPRRRRGPATDIEDELRRDEQAEHPRSEARSDRDGKHAPKEFPDVLGWQPLVLNRAQACADCGVHLLKGDRAFLGVEAGGLTALALCAKCVQR